MPDRSHRGSDLNLAWQTPPWAKNSGETVDATDREEPGEQRTEGEVAALDALDDRGDGDAAAAVDLETAVSLFAEVIATTSPAEAHARLLRPTGDDLTSPDYTIQIDPGDG